MDFLQSIISFELFNKNDLAIRYEAARVGLIVHIISQCVMTHLFLGYVILEKCIGCQRYKDKVL